MHPAEDQVAPPFLFFLHFLSHILELVPSIFARDVNRNCVMSVGQSGLKGTQNCQATESRPYHFHEKKLLFF